MSEAEFAIQVSGAGGRGGLLAAGVAAGLRPAQRAERPALNITGYVIDAEMDTTTHHLTATAQVSFTAPGANWNW